MIFKDRLDAAEQLVPHLKHIKGPGVVFAVPRGGVPMGRYVAHFLGWPLRPLLIKKIGHPQNPEYAIGAVTLDGVEMDSIPADVSETYLEQEARKLTGLLKQRQQAYGFFDADKSLAGKTVLVIDDGVATGRTLLAGITWLKRKNPDSIILAVPVAASEALDKLEAVCDRVICLYQPEEFFGVGQFYESFPQVEDEDVEKELAASR
ncbi:MAG: phosphoribosyltransferase [Bacteroidota bacterium]